MVSSITLDPYSIEKSPEVTSLAMVIFATPGCPISSYFTNWLLDRFGEQGTHVVRVHTVGQSMD